MILEQRIPLKPRVSNEWKRFWLSHPRARFRYTNSALSIVLQLNAIIARAKATFREARPQ